MISTYITNFIARFGLFFQLTNQQSVDDTMVGVPPLTVCSGGTDNQKTLNKVLIYI